MWQARETTILHLVWSYPRLLLFERYLAIMENLSTKQIFLHDLKHL